MNERQSKDRFQAGPIAEQLRRLQELFPDFAPRGVTRAAEECLPPGGLLVERIDQPILSPSILLLGDRYGRSVPHASQYMRAFCFVHRLLCQYHPAFNQTDPQSCWAESRHIDYPRLDARTAAAYARAEIGDHEAYVLPMHCGPDDDVLVGSNASVYQSYESVATRLLNARQGEFQLDPVVFMIALLTHPDWRPVGDVEHPPWIVCMGAHADTSQQTYSYPLLNFGGVFGRRVGDLGAELILASEYGSPLRASIAKSYMRSSRPSPG